MKNLKLLFHVIIIAYISVSCSNDLVPDNGTEKYSYIISDTTNYWNRNTLKQFNLKGNVRSIAYYGRTYIFNQLGFLSNITYGQSNYQYTYDSNNRMTALTTDYDGTTTFHYNKTGKFIPYDPYIDYTQTQEDIIKLLPSKYIPILIQNLSTVTSTNEYRKYQFLNDSTLQVFINKTNSINHDTIHDTAIVKYHGAYPITMLWKTDMMKYQIDNIKYASNGMFVSYTDCGTLPYQENFSDNKTSWINYQFLNNNNYLAPVIIYGTMYNKSYLYNKYYFYNKNLELEKDSILDGNIFNVQKYTNYVYDKYYNWKNRTYSFNNSQSILQERTFTYW
jgi:hypothetical protein